MLRVRFGRGFGSWQALRGNGNNKFLLEVFELQTPAGERRFG